MNPVVFFKYSLSSTAKTLIEMGATAAQIAVASHAIITVTGNAVWFRIDSEGDAPAADDHYIVANETIILDGLPMFINFRAVSATGTAKIAVTLCN